MTPLTQADRDPISIRCHSGLFIFSIWAMLISMSWTLSSWLRSRFATTWPSSKSSSSSSNCLDKFKYENSRRCRMWNLPAMVRVLTKYGTKLAGLWEIIWQTFCNTVAQHNNATETTSQNSRQNRMGRIITIITNYLILCVYVLNLACLGTLISYCQKTTPKKNARDSNEINESHYVIGDRRAEEYSS